ncbi:MAG: diguanylate cyclase, partial [Acidithiobacillus ferrivorans]
MTRYNSRNVADGVDPEQANASRPDGTAMYEETLIQDRENVVTAREAMVCHREGVTQRREGVVSKREEVTLARERSVSTREQDCRSKELLKTATDEHLALVQKANAHLVIATLEAHELTEQV